MGLFIYYRPQITRGVTLIFCLCYAFSVKGQAPEGYYDGLEVFSGDLLKRGLNNLVRDHIEYRYSSTSTDVWDILKEADQDPENPDNVILFYTGWSMNAEAEYNRGQGWTREHVWAKSHGDFGTDPGAGTDLHALRPADVTVNSARNNKDFDEGGEFYIDGDGPTTNRVDADSWEPRNEIKGDVARCLFYMAVRYEGSGNEPDLELVDSVRSVDSNQPNIGYHGKLSQLLKWHLQDPVDDSELARNDVIFSYQGNRNPFIDNPSWVSKIWDTTGLGGVETFIPPSVLIEEDITDTLNVDSVIAAYYEDFELLEGKELKDSLYQLIRDQEIFSYTSTSRTDVWDILKESDKDTLDNEHVILFYSGRSVDAEQEFNNGLGWAREHIWPSDHGDFGISRGPGTDLHHIRPTDNTVSRARGNLDFDVGGVEYIDAGDSTNNFFDEDSWEPRASVKGDIARMLFYMATRYEGENGEPDLELLNAVQTVELTEDGKGFHGKLATLLQWHEEDPVDTYERRRNNVIYIYQRNRNPFIDHPEYVYRIWDPLLFDSTIVNYYRAIDSTLDGDGLKRQLHNLIDEHQVYPYTATNTDVWDILKVTDADPNNAGNVQLFYTGWAVEASQEFNNSKGWSREDIWSTAHGSLLDFSAAATDVHAIRPADITVNRARGVLDFDEGGTLYIDGNGITQNFRKEDSWEPRDAVKGDIARMLFYMAVRYEGEEDEPELELLDTVGTADLSSPGVGYHGRLSTLLTWHQNDPVSRFERRRNQKIFEFQGNRNPFIDHPEFASIIWASSSTDTSQIATHSKTNLSEEIPFQVYPNPSEGAVSIRWSASQMTHRSSLRLYTMEGKLVESIDTGLGAITQLNLYKYPEGIYLLRYGSYSELLVKK